MKEKDIILFVDGNVTLEVPITPEKDTVWLTQDQMSQLFDTARSSIAYHIGNIFKEGELNKDTSVEIFDRSEKQAYRPPLYYNLDVIISVGYRVKSKRGVAFRKWANKVLKDYILKGYAVNHNRISQSLQRKAHFSEMKRMILLKEVSGQFTKHSAGQKSILHWRKKLRICFIF